MKKYLVTYETPISFGRDMGYPETHTRLVDVSNMFNLPPKASNVEYFSVEKLTEDQIAILVEEEKNYKKKLEDEELDSEIKKQEESLAKLYAKKENQQ